jgi:hypothetical protein
MQSFCTILFLNCKFPSLPFLKSLKQKNAFFGCPSLVRRSSGFQLPGPHGAQFGRPPRCGKPAKNCPILQVTPSRVWKSNSANGLSLYFKHKILGDVTLFYTEKEHILRRKKFSLLNFILCFLFCSFFWTDGQLSLLFEMDVGLRAPSGKNSECDFYQLCEHK